MQTAPGVTRKFGDIYSSCPLKRDTCLDHRNVIKNLNMPLRLLVENEIFRLSVWSNPSNDAKRGADHPGNVEKIMVDVSVGYPMLCIC